MTDTHNLQVLLENVGSAERFVIVLRGCSGCGKSTLADLFAQPKVVVSADSYFEQNGGYDFDPSKLGDAHKHCMSNFDKALNNPGIRTIVVANTNTKPSDYEYYQRRAKEAGAKFISLVIEKRHEGVNVHGVPDHVLQRQHDNLKNDLKLA